ncbi:MAG: hypothetical protein ACYCVB_03920 [Bacilli bacterium]
MGDFHSTAELEERVVAFIQRWKAVHGDLFNWTFRGYPMQQEAA